MDDFEDINVRSWRSVGPADNRAAPLTSPVMKRRRLRSFFKGIFYACLLCACILGVLWAVKYVREHPQILHLGEPMQPVSTLDYSTSGVLSQQWVQDFIGFGAENFEPDVKQLQKKLEDTVQVRQASLERIWPDILKIRLVEEEPVARVAVALPDGRKAMYLVSRRGAVYQGRQYAQSTLRELPWLDGVLLRRAEKGYAPLAGMSTVAELLDEARARLPNVRAQFKVVSLEDFDGDVAAPWSVIRVKSENLGEIVFAPRQFARQLDYLATAVNDFASKNLKVKRIDLSTDGMAVAQLQDGQGGQPPRTVTVSPGARRR